MRTRRIAVVVAALAAVAIAVFWGRGIVGGPTGQERARLVAATFLGVSAEELDAGHVPDPRYYRFLLRRAGKVQATLSVTRDGGTVASGSFFAETRDEGKSEMERDDAIEAAARFAHKHFEGLGDLGRPTQVVPSESGPTPVWHVTWDIAKPGEPWRYLSVTLHRKTGTIRSFVAHASSGPPQEPLISRDEAISKATAAMVKDLRGAPVRDAKASLWRGAPDRPAGYPVWQVDALSVLPDGARAGVGRRIDGITGEVMPLPPSALPPRRQPPPAPGQR